MPIKKLTITSLRLDRTEKVKRTQSYSAEENHKELEQKLGIAVEEEWWSSKPPKLNSCSKRNRFTGKLTQASP